MKAIVIKQPFASAIILGKKTVENRTWPTKYRGPLAIVAGRSKEYLKLDWSDDLPGIEVPNLPRGFIIGTVELVDCVEFGKAHASDPWACGPWCFLLTNAKQLSKPIPIVGKLGIYPLPDDISKSLR